ncbi:GAF domain-containing SpoIIE family protein phosphatase [Desulfobacula sp.]|uniref:GAF domain-containing SpoIIE family protein phosphatase n=1 Tax=Desulfobacula sp. TaxID=2593537 RepID=UPI0025C419E7|nr:GAF domain-containing SpoIIE family protein phosphatase [Desulfobacula sp.]
MELERLQKEITALKREKKVHDAQNRLFEIFINMARSSKEEQVLNVTMQNALEIAAQLSGAEKGSLFLLDKSGVVTDSILTRDQIRGEKRSSLIGKVIDKGLAGWVKKNLSVGLVADAKTDARWLTLAKQSYIVRSALAVPILRHDTLFGIITLMHSLPSHFDQASVVITQQAANQMAIAIENAKLYRKLEQSKILLENAKQSIEKYSKALNDELEKGKKIQKDFLPRYLPEVKNCDVSSYFHSALQLSGDFYDMFELPDNHIGFVIGDVSDKGVGSALFMALTRSLLRIFSGLFDTGNGFDNATHLRENFLPEDALKAVFLTNEYIAKEHCEEGMFVTLFFGIIDLLTGKVFYINAGHEPVLVVGENGIKQSLKTTGPALGPIQGAIYGIETIQLKTGDMLFGYTDGVTEARSETRVFYTRSRLENIINKGFDGATEAFLEIIKTDLFLFIGNAPQSDDITMLAVKWHP